MEGCVDICPGCRYRSYSPEESDRAKHTWASSSLSPFAVEPIRTPANRWGYRRKTLLHAKHGERGWEFGLIRREGPQRRVAVLVPIPSCPLHEPVINERLQVLRTLLPAGLPLAFVLCSGTLLTLVLKCAPEDSWRAWARLQESPLRASGVQGLQLNWNPAAGRRALSSRHQELIFGAEFVSDGELLHGAQSFRQQIPELEAVALALAEQHLAGTEPAVDLYCGVGAMLHRWRAQGRNCAGVELVAEACRAATLNAPGALVLKGKVEQRLPQLSTFLANREFALYTNPPREGHAPQALHWIVRTTPGRIAYLSCNQRTLARDLEVLEPRYHVERVIPFDFFPQTDHVESLTLLRRANPPFSS